MSTRRWSRRGFVASLAAGVAAPLISCSPAGRVATVARPAAAPLGPAGPGLAVRLGFPSDARLLLIHLDDLGLLHSVNAAAAAVFDLGLVRSGSLMAPCPWFPEAVEYALGHPTLDLGLHLSFTCERHSYRWGPILGPSVVPSLVDKDGCFPVSWDPDRPVNLRELEAELRAQLERAHRYGFTPTHLDSHEHILQWRGPEVFDVFQRVAGEHRLPVRVGRNWFQGYPYLARALGSNGIAMDSTLTIPPGIAPTDWTAWYLNTIGALRPGVTEIFLHPGYDDGELRAFAPDRVSWGAAWRQRDLDAISSPAVHDAVIAAGATIITWREIGRLLTS